MILNCNILLQAHAEDVTNKVIPFIILAIAVCFLAIKIMNIITAKINALNTNSKRIVRGILFGWLLFVISISAYNKTNSSNIDYEESRDVINLFLMSLPGALLGVIVAVIMNNNEQGIKKTETLETKINGLKNLLDQGLLTQEEFDEQKKKILNSK